jgi:hypothetical protein
MIPQGSRPAVSSGCESGRETGYESGCESGLSPLLGLPLTPVDSRSSRSSRSLDRSSTLESVLDKVAPNVGKE